MLAHGWGANHGTVLPLAEPLAEAGHDVLLFDVRGHGRNERLPYVTVKHFRDDLMAVARYAAKRFPDRQLVVIGHSMGGAAAVLASADGAPVDGLVLVAAPSDVIRITKEFLTDNGLPGGLMVNLLRPFLWRRVGGGFRSLTPSRRIGELDLPILLIQPEHDARVEREHANRLAAAAGLDVHLIRDREHTDVLSAPDTLRLIEGFLEDL
jgi:alpha-beta hydrolase superfamily lysophospholipase